MVLLLGCLHLLSGFLLLSLGVVVGSVPGRKTAQFTPKILRFSGCSRPPTPPCCWLLVGTDLARSFFLLLQPLLVLPLVMSTDVVVGGVHVSSLLSWSFFMCLFVLQEIVDDRPPYCLEILITSSAVMDLVGWWQLGDALLHFP